MAHSHRKHRKPRFRRRSLPGTAPGTITVDPAARTPTITLLAYGNGQMKEARVTTVAEIATLREQFPLVWVNVDGLGDAETIRALGQEFGLHPLALEDTVNTHQRAKVDIYDDHLFIVARMVVLKERLESEQISLYLGKNFVLTFLEDPGDAFEPVRNRLRGTRSRVHTAGPAYLAYSLIDATVDTYFPVIEEYGERLDQLEDVIIARPDRDGITQIHNIKQDLRSLRRVVWPHREMLNQMSRESSPLVDDESRVYFRDCYDHTVQIVDLVETYRELGSDLTDLYLSSLSNRMNEVMKVLTMIATIFMPLSFIAGLYGMNFDHTASPWNMPEVRAYYGYPSIILVMTAVAIGMLLFFRRKGWLGPSLPYDPLELQSNGNDRLGAPPHARGEHV